jgi:acyl dehydratase
MRPPDTSSQVAPPTVSRARAGFPLSALAYGVPRIGQRFVSRPFKISERDISLCANLIDQWYKRHIRAESGIEAVGHGSATEHATSSLIAFAYMAGLGLCAFGEGDVVALQRIHGARLISPIQADDTITTQVEVVDVCPVTAGAGSVWCRWSIVQQNSEPVIDARVNLVWRKQPPSAPEPGLADDWLLAAEVPV